MERSLTYDAWRFPRRENYLARSGEKSTKTISGVVIIAATATNAPSLTRLLVALRARTGLTLLLMQHAAPLNANFFPRMSASEDFLQVVEAQDGALLCPGELHLIPPDHAASVHHGRLRLRPLQPTGRQRRTLDLLFCAAAKEYKSRAMVVWLSGTELHGLRGARAVRAAGGLVLAQDPTEAPFDNLPPAASLAQAVDAVLPIAAMPAALLAHVAQEPALADDFLPTVISLLQPETPQRLSVYRPATLRRRVQRRIDRLELSQPEYVDRLLRDATERALLTQDILVHVGAFFRDRPALRALARQHLPGLVAAHPANTPLRVWVPGCGTGEESWSLAILLREAIQAAGRSIPLQIIASDIHAETLATARAGLYPHSITEAVSAERIASFFEHEAAGWRIRPELRAMAVFAVHDALADPPFAAIDIIACGPLMRHLAGNPRARLVERLVSVLRPGGLLLATAEPSLNGAPPVAAAFTGLEVLAPGEGIWRRPPARPAAAPALQDRADAAEMERRVLYAELAVRAQEQRATLDAAREARADLRNLVGAPGMNLLFLDPWLQLRFHTQGAAEAFGLGPLDLGRPLDALHGLPADPTLAEDAARVMREGGSAEREVRGQAGTIFLRQVRPYLAEDGSTDGVVLAFPDITTGANAGQALEEARAEASKAQAARARFVVLADQDLHRALRQMQVLQGLLGQTVREAEAGRLLRLQGAALAALTGLVGRLVKGAVGEAGTLVPEPEAIPLEAVLRRIATSFRGPVATAGGSLRLVPTRLAIRTDPVLFARLLEGLLAQVIEAVGPSRLLLGCRRRGSSLCIELWASQDGRKPAAGPSRGAGALRTLYPPSAFEPLQALAGLLGHKLCLRGTRAGGGAWFSLDVARVPRPPPQPPAAAPPRRAGRILVVEPDAEERAALMRQLQTEGHTVAGAAGPGSAMDRAAAWWAPELLLTGPGLEEEEAAALAFALRARFGEAPALLALVPAAPAATVAGPEAAQDGAVPSHADDGLVRLPYPPSPRALSLLVQRLLVHFAEDPLRMTPEHLALDHAAGRTPEQLQTASVVHLLHGDAALRHDLRRVLERDGQAVEEHVSAEDFLAVYRPSPRACLVLDGELAGRGGLDLLVALRALSDGLPCIMLTGFGDVPAAVQALRAGASDFLETPVQPSALLAVLAGLRARMADRTSQSEWRNDAAARIARLTPRQRDIMNRVLAGQPSKNIAADLGISRRTVETHRAAIMRQTGTRSLPALARLALAAARGPAAPEG